MNFAAGMQIGGQDATFGGMRNRIINGSMQFNQRANDGLCTGSAAREYRSCDRWAIYQTTASKLTITQNLNSITPPAGFTNYLGITTTNTQNSSGDLYVLQQMIEGNYLYGLDLGTSNAKPFTISFWVRSSLTGTFGFQIGDTSGNASYAWLKSYTINSANTWEYKTITFSGATGGSWPNSSGIGMHVTWDLGCGSSYNTATSSSWGAAASAGWGLTGGQKIVNTSGATFYITGVQLEVGTTATSFEYRSYGHELGLCQRYFQKLGNASYVAIGSGFLASVNTSASGYVKYTTTMRSAPTTTFTSLIVTDRIGYDSPVANFTSTAGTDSLYYSLTCAAGGTPYYPNVLTVTSGTTGFLALSAEL
jgi:hypothetical protein